MERNWNTTDKTTAKPLDRQLSYLKYFALAEKGVFEKSTRGMFLRKVFSRRRYSSNRNLDLEQELKELVEADTLARVQRGNLARFEDDGNSLDLGDDVFEPRILRTDINNLLQSNTLICAAARVGKSTALRHFLVQVVSLGAQMQPARGA